MSTNPEIALSRTLTAGRRISWQEKLVLNLLEPMHKGYLEIILPDGTRRTYGSPQESLKASIRIINPDFFRKVVLYGDIGFGESYMDGDWDTESITDVISWFLLNIENSPAISGSRRRFAPVNILKTLNRWYHLARPNNLTKARKNIAEHYDLSNDFFQTFLDPSMTYSSAYFETPDMTLEQAQYAKYDRLCRYLKIQPTDHVLEIGSGWGGMAIHIAKHYGAKVTTITISKEQYALAKQRIAEAGLSDRIEILFTDYRRVTGSFDKIVSIEMLEAVGDKFLKPYFKKVHALLKKDGALGIQVITSPDSRYESFRKNVDWIQKHIFPGSLLPSIAALNKAVNETGDLNLLDLKNLGLDYARTLAIWRDTFNRNLKQVKDLGFSDTFIRKWNYYLSYCEAAFRMRNINVMQMIYARPNSVNL